ncbi:MAG: RHS repeat-associated core domain-containing protein [Litorimonas sp.]
MHPKFLLQQNLAQEIGTKRESKQKSLRDRFKPLTKLISTIACALPLAVSGTIANSYEPDLPPGGGPSNQPNPPTLELEKRQGAEHRLEAFGATLLGDGIDPNTGTVKFEVTDVSLPGNFALPVQITRSISQGRFYDRTVATEFGDWQISAPRLHALTRTGFNWTGNRCTNSFAQSFPSHVMRQGTTWYRHQYTDGFNMVIPGQGSKSVLEYTGSTGGNSLWPSGTQFTTVDGWRLSCGSSNSGQGFIGHAPDGTKYRFDKVFTHKADEMGSTFGGGLSMQRTRNFIAASLVTDVHGNTVNYDYDSSGRLTAIRASDGRRINLNYTGSSKLIRSVTANPGTSDARTWTYSYASKTFPEIYNNGTVPNSLTQVTQPDGLNWSYNMAGMSADPGPNQQCPQTSQNVTATHPHGVKGTFLIGQTYQRISYNLQETVVYGCPGFNEITPGNFPQWHMKKASIMSVSRKTLSAPGLASQQWNFLYEYDSGAANSSGSDRTNWSKVTDPEGIETKYRHYWQAEPFGGKAASVEVIDNGSVLQRADHTYQYEGSFGNPLVATGTTVQSSRRPTHNISTTVQRDGSTYVATKAFQTNQSSPSTYSWSKPITIVTNPDFGTTNTQTTNITYQNNATKWINGRVKTTSFQGAPWEELFYDSYGRLTEYRKHGDRLATYTYHTATGRKGALNRFRRYTTSSAYDETLVPTYDRGTPTLVNRPDGTSISRTIDRNGWVTSATDGRGNTTDYDYDDMGRLTLIDRPDNWLSASIAYNFSNPGAIQTVTKGNARTTVTYDPMFRETLLRSQALDTGWSSYVKTSYDRLNRKTFMSLPSTSNNPSQGTNYTYDGLGREIQTAENVSPYATTQTAYLAQNAVQVTDAAGNITTTYNHGHSGPGKGEPLSIVQPMGVSTVLHRDSFGRVFRVQQSGNHNGYSVDESQYYYFDGNHNICRSRTPEGGDTLSMHNLAGQLTSYSKGHGAGTACSTPTGNSKVTLTYDDMGRPTVTNFQDSNTPDITKTYDANGNVLTVNRGTGGSAVDWTYTYNSLNMLTSETLDIDGRSFPMSYSYNNAGYRIGSTMPTGPAISYAPDGLGRMLSVTSGTQYVASNTDFHVSGAVKSMLYGNGQTLTQTFNARFLPENRRVAIGNLATLEQKLSYDVLGKITSLLDIELTSNNRTYGYDALGRLTSSTGPWGAGSYDYDSLGNLRSKAEGSRTVNLTYDNRNRLITSIDSLPTTQGGTAYRTVAYDARGNVTTLGHLGMAYDMSDQPVTVTGAANGIGYANGNYVYDGNMKRVKSVVNGKTSYWVYDAAGQLVYNDKVSLNRQLQYIYSAGNSLARCKVEANGSCKMRYLIRDYLGSVVQRNDPNGIVKASLSFKPFGEEIGTSSGTDSMGFTGHIKDTDTGLNYMQARYYDPVIGRFLSIDPVTALDGGSGYFNRYSYAFNNPINNQDSTGEYVEGTVSPSGNNVSLVVPLQRGPNVSEVAFMRVVRGANQWAGTYGKYNVTVDVVLRSDTKGPTNTVRSRPGVGRAFVSGGRRDVTLYRTSAGETPKHEVGHLFGLPDKYLDVIQDGKVVGSRAKPGTDGATNIMGLGSSITEADITAIIENKGNNIVKTTNGSNPPPVSNQLSGNHYFSISGSVITGTRSCGSRLGC